MKRFIAMLTIVIFRDLWVNKASVIFLYNKWTFKKKIKHRYNYTDSALMG